MEVGEWFWPQISISTLILVTGNTSNNLLDTHNCYRGSHHTLSSPANSSPPTTKKTSLQTGRRRRRIKNHEKRERKNRITNRSKPTISAGLAERARSAERNQWRPPSAAGEARLGFSRRGAVRSAYKGLWRMGGWAKSNKESAAHGPRIN